MALLLFVAATFKNYPKPYEQPTYPLDHRAADHFREEAIWLMIDWAVIGAAYAGLFFVLKSK